MYFTLREKTTNLKRNVSIKIFPIQIIAKHNIISNYQSVIGNN